MEKLRTLKIVVEETGPRLPDGNQPFIVYLEGDTQRLDDKKIKDNELSSAEYWGARLFGVCADLIVKTGAGIMQKQRDDLQ